MYAPLPAADHGPVSDCPVFLTGATGFVGMELLARYLHRTDRQIHALVRATDDDDADARLQATIARVVPDPARYADRVIAVRGDVCEPGLGLDAAVRDELAET